MPKYVLDRRRFLRRSGRAVLAVTAAGRVAFFDPDRSWAITLEAFDEKTARTLLAMTRALYPHPSLGDEYYAVVVEALDAEARKDNATASLIADGVAKLDSALGVPFTALSEGTRTEVLEGMQEDPFFQKVRGSVVFHFYNNKLVWRHFGYEGSSFEYGGYIRRGF
ncbi:MAG TPA: hypothetical protein ENJ38_04730, partial [Rhodospirillales bacterium]|nr:hypothetical protein [Rhodospirillales bacterium]